MHGQPVRGDINPVSGQTRRHHPPADRPLRPAQRAQKQQAGCPACRYTPRGKEAQKSHGPDQPDHPAQLAVPPFPPVDGLERLQRHPRVLKLVFRAGAVLVELCLPACGIQRRQGPRDRLPFGDRQSAVGQPCCAADRDHQDNKREQNHQPYPDCAARAATTAPVDHTTLRQGRGGPRPDLFKDTALASHWPTPHSRRTLGRPPARFKADLRPRHPYCRRRAICRSMP